MMSETESHSSADANWSADADWRQLEAFVEQIHEWAHSSIETDDFYRRLLEGCVTLLAAEGGTVWLPTGRSRWRALHRINSKADQDRDPASVEGGHLGLLQGAARASEPLVVPPRSRSAAGGENSTAFVLALVGVCDATLPDSHDRAHSVIELTMRPGISPEVQQGWKELLATVAEIATEFHVREQLHALRKERGIYDQSLRMMRRFQQSSELQQTAFEMVNEGRRFVTGDRLSLVVRRGNHWHLLATSGVDRVEARADVAKRLQKLAASTADWGEPWEHADATGADLHDGVLDWPPGLAEQIEQHADESQARHLVAVPIEFGRETEEPSRQNRVTAVVIAEQFTSEIGEFSLQRVLELAGLCEPALRQAMQWDRFPLRSCLRWADRWANVREKLGLTKLAMASVAALAMVLALVFVKIDYEVEAPATLTPLVERDLFAATDGKIVEVRIVHGEQVAAGDVLAVLDDPQLSLDAERVDGEIETTRKRLEAIAVARTDRQVREEVTNEKLPLSAEIQQLERRLASLRIQQDILMRRREALKLRSPIAGTVLTIDVQNLLQSRPVERGQVLFTVADISAGWRLEADVPQDRIGQVVAARRPDTELPARFRLAGEPEQIYHGHVDSISTTAVLDTAGLDQDSPSFVMIVHVDDSDLASARPGMSAQVRVLCGRRSLGYVWLHDLWETIYSWLVF